MTEPRLEPGQSWEQLIGCLLEKKDSLEIALQYAEPWERDDLKTELRTTYFHLDCAVRQLEAQEQEIDW